MGQELDDDDHRRNRRNTDPVTSHQAAEQIDQDHKLIVGSFMLQHDRPAGWTYGEVSDATGLKPDAVWRRMSDLSDDGLICWARDYRGEVINRIWRGSGRAQQARKLGTEPGPSDPPPLPADWLLYVRMLLANQATWLHSVGRHEAAKLIERAVRELRE